MPWLELTSDDSPHPGCTLLVALCNAGLFSGSDSFTGTNGTNLSGRALDTGGSWTAQTGAWQITSNQAVETTNSNAAYLLTTDTTQSNYTVQVDLGVPGSTNVDAGVVVRYQDVNNYFFAIAENTTLKLYELNGGTVTQRGAAAGVLTLGTTATIKVVCSGSSFTVYVGGASQITYTSTDFQTATLVGLRNYRGTGYNQATFDNFSWTSP